MKLHYHRDTDSLYIDLSASIQCRLARSRYRCGGGFDPGGKLVGIDIDHANSVADLSRVGTESLPMRINVVRDD